MKGIPNRLKDLVGSKFGDLTVIKYLSTHDRSRYWECECICGGKISLPTRRLNYDAVSCGCRHKNNFSKIGKSKFKGAGVSGFNNLIRGYRKSAQERNLSFDLTEEQFKSFVEKECFYCGIPPTQISKVAGTSHMLPESVERGKFKYNGIDRRDNNLGYSLGNCITSCKDCNFAKRCLSHEAFINLVLKIASRHGRTE